jgi:hypothetical protein
MSVDSSGIDMHPNGAYTQAHPPRAAPAGYKLQLNSQEQLKGLIRRATLHYHPDKQGGQDLHWHVLAEEITKALVAAAAAL